MGSAALTHPTLAESGALNNGRSYYYSQPNQLFVVVDPGNVDSGSAYAMTAARWPSYKQTLK
jgi:hypothetical protein